MWGLENKASKTKKVPSRVNTLPWTVFFLMPKSSEYRHFGQGKRPEGLRWQSKKLHCCWWRWSWRCSKPPSPTECWGGLPIKQLPNFIAHHARRTPSESLWWVHRKPLFYCTVTKDTIIKRCFSVSHQKIVLEILSCSKLKTMHCQLQRNSGIKKSK